MRILAVPLALSTLWAAAAGVPTAHAAKRDVVARSWIEGPILYIISAAERKEYKALKTDDERFTYIERFWARRDPTPATLANEYRQMFWTRVREANEKFADSATPGWKTDRGKIYILYGAPQEIQQDLEAETRADPTAGRGLIRWIYEGRPGQRMDVDPIVVVPFFRDVSGAWRLTDEPTLNSVYLDWFALRDPKPMGWGRWLLDPGLAPRSRLGVLQDLGKMQEAPADNEVLLEQVKTFSSFRSSTLRVDFARYRMPGSTDTLVVATFPLPGPESPEIRPEIVAQFVAAADPTDTRTLAEGSFRLRGDGERRIGQTRLPLPPGTWNVTLFAVDPQLQSSGLFRGSIVVGPAGPGLALSDVVLARRLEPIPYASMIAYDEPYMLGAFKVEPLAGGSIRRGEPVQVFYELYGATGPARVSYRLEGKEDDGSFRALGAPAVKEGAEGAQGWSIDTGPAWPLGEYRIRILVEDPSGSTAEALVPFRLEAEPL